MPTPSLTPALSQETTRHTLESFYFQVRQMTEFLCHPLETEDYVVQPIEDVSPPKWHLAHTTWFFEVNILKALQHRYQPFNEKFLFLFNSYYESFGDKHPRAQRGILPRPTVKEIFSYRRTIDEKMRQLIKMISEEELPELVRLTTLGLNHEQQHQELLVTDVKYIFGTNPLYPVYNRNRPPVHFSTLNDPPPLDESMTSFKGGLVETGSSSNSFTFDNERPLNKVYLAPYKLRNKLVTNREYISFIQDGGYQNFEYWLSDGWDWVKREKWEAPLYWRRRNGAWYTVTLHGLQPLQLDEPVCHISFYEADAFAKWKGLRLPTEAEWENAAKISGLRPDDGNFLEDHLYHPRPASQDNDEKSPALKQMMGDVWEWTSSAYRPYPGFVPEAGALAEYNGKFMSNQMVLKGGSCATPRSHIRFSYRNFFQGEKRWQFSGIRLAQDG